MSNNNDDTYKKKGYDDDIDTVYHCSPWESAILIPSDQTTRSTNMTTNRNDFPGSRRIPIVSSDVPAGIVLIRTAGNALQAIPATILEEKQQPQQQLIEVQVPPNTQPGDTIHVRSPYTQLDDEVLIAAKIPDGLYPGQTFYVNCPPTDGTNTQQSAEITAVAIATKTEDDENNKNNNNNQCSSWWF